MTRDDIISTFRHENPRITTNVLSNAVLYDWCIVGDKDICARTRCIVDQDGTDITPSENDTYVKISSYIPKFYDIDEFPGSGVLYNSKRIKRKTMSELDEEAATWRSRTAGTPKAYYRRGDYIYFDRPIDSNAYTVTIYCILVPNDFDAATKTPFNELGYLEPFHYGVVKYLQWQAKKKVGKGDEGEVAKKEYLEYIAYMYSMIGGGRIGKIRMVPRYNR